MLHVTQKKQRELTGMATKLPHVTCVGNHGKCCVKHCVDGANLALTITLLLGCNLGVMVLEACRDEVHRVRFFLSLS